MAQVFRPDAHAFIADAHRDEGVFHFAGNKYRAAIPAEFDGVADQIHPDMLHHLAIVAAGQMGQVQFKDQAAGRPLAFQTQHTGTDLFIQVVVGLLTHQLLVFVPGNQQHIAGQLGEPFGFLCNKVQIFVLLFRGQPAPAQPPGKAPDGNNGGLEFMGKGVDEVVAHHFGTAQFGSHAVEAAQQLGNITAAAFLHPHRVIPPGDGLGGLHHILNGFSGHPADKGGNRDCQQDGQQHRHPGPQGLFLGKQAVRQRHPYKHRHQPGQQVADHHTGDEPPPGGVHQTAHHSRTAL